MVSLVPKRKHPDQLGPLKVALGTPPDTGCCGIAAVAAVSGVDFPTAFRFFRAGRSRKYMGRTNHYDRVRALNNFGIDYTDLTDKVRGKLPLASWVRHFADKNATYLVTTRNHAQVISGDYVLDQSGVRPVYNDWTGSRGVLSVLEIHNARFT
jgi:hypothetical protein